MYPPRTLVHYLRTDALNLFIALALLVSIYSERRICLGPTYTATSGNGGVGPDGAVVPAGGTAPTINGTFASVNAATTLDASWSLSGAKPEGTRTPYTMSPEYVEARKIVFQPLRLKTASKSFAKLRDSMSPVGYIKTADPGAIFVSATSSARAISWPSRLQAVKALSFSVSRSALAARSFASAARLFVMATFSSVICCNLSADARARAPKTASPPTPTKTRAFAQTKLAVSHHSLCFEKTSRSATSRNSPQSRTRSDHESRVASRANFPLSSASSSGIYLYRLAKQKHSRTTLVFAAIANLIILYLILLG